MAEETIGITHKTFREIPIKNIYYLFLYAWDRFPEGREIQTGADESPEVLDLLARVLVNGVTRLIRRGIDRGYHAFVDVLKAPKGRFLLLPSIAQATLISNQLVCSFDEITPDILPNRILKSTLRALRGVDALHPNLRSNLASLERRFGEVKSIELSRSLFQRVQLSRNNAHYDLLLKICELVLHALQPDQRGELSKFSDILEDEERMSVIFESFVRNFYSREQNKYSVAAEGINWAAEFIDPSQQRFLPTMHTDVTLRSNSRVIVIDAKFYKKTLVSFMGGAPKIRSGHLYQLLAYLNNMALAGSPQAEGVLLYPRTAGA